jgi:hypothetical protein
MGTNAREYHEDRCAEVRDPASEEEDDGRAIWVSWIEPRTGEEIADVVEHHQHDHDSPEQVHTRRPPTSPGWLEGRLHYDGGGLGNRAHEGPSTTS